MNIRIGYGWDSHAFKPGVPLKIGGLAIDHPEGLAGHSDGDVLLHAITDALLGAVSAGDIGSFFPPGDPRWKDADSSIFLNLALEEIQNAGYRILNIDTTLVLSAPKIGPLPRELRERVADLLNVRPIGCGNQGQDSRRPERSITSPRHTPLSCSKRSKIRKNCAHERCHREPKAARRRSEGSRQPGSWCRTAAQFVNRSSIRKTSPERMRSAGHGSKSGASEWVFEHFRECIMTLRS